MKSFSIKDIKGNPGRSVALMVLSVLLSFCILSGSLVLTGLRSGLKSLDLRLGADVMVVPYKAATENYLEDAILMGNTGYYYMPASRMNEIREKVDGVAQMSPQLFLATTTASCCSYRVSVVGFDPKTDFTITPWIQSTYNGTLEDQQVIVGHDMNAYPGDVIQFFGVSLTVAARLDQTGTYLDTAAYTNMTTAKTLVAAAKEKGLFQSSDYNADPESMVSCIMIRVAEGYTAAEVEGAIKTHVRQVATVKTETSVEDVSDKLTGIQHLAVILIAVVWILIFIVEMVAFRMNFTSRMKEFAIIRTVGASKKELSGILMREAFYISFLGSVIGAAAGLLVMELFSGQIQKSLDMPFLLPGGWTMVLIFALCAAVSVLAGVLSALSAAGKAGNVDAALILRGEN